MSFKVFDHICPACNHEEPNLLVTEAEKPLCPECGVVMTRKLSAPAGISIKGAVDSGMSFTGPQGQRCRIGPLREYKNGKLGEKI